MCGKPLLLTRVDMQRIIYQYGLQSGTYIAILVIAVCLFCFLFCLVFYKKMQLSRYERRQSEELYLSMISQASESILLIETVGFKILEANTAFQQLLGYAPEELSSLDLYTFLAEDRPEVDWTVQQILDKKRGYLGERKFLRKNGEIVAVEINANIINTNETHIVCMIAKDISARNHNEGDLFYMVNHDPLTGLPNRTLLLDRLNQAIFKHDRAKKMIAVMFFDLDQFKFINDTYGHAIGDNLLKEVAGRVQGFVRKSDTLARLGGDEFTLIIESISWPRDAIHVAQKILDAMVEPFRLDVGDLFITASIGITCYPIDCTSAEGLLKNADTAMYHAKEQGRNNYQFFSRELNDKMCARLEMENGLRQALERSEFVLYYQPRVHALTGDLLGVEALLRWQHPEKGLILPLSFIPLAEETGLIVPIGEWVLRNACEQNKFWQDAGLPPFKVSVNVSVRQFSNQWLVTTVQKILHETALKPEFLELEITESILMKNPNESLLLLSDLKKMGISIAIDDFGTGYSSLMQLKYLPIDILKIDKNFIAGIGQDKNDETLVSIILQMAESFGFGVVAEGVETKEQINYLTERNCYVLQGYYFSKPLPGEGFREYLEKKYAQRHELEA
jgi:diguanylate cyclase (GGDEF)-like protein/PAS domain S-box-containing protein